MNAAVIFCFLTFAFFAMAAGQVDVHEWYRGVDFDVGCRPAPVTGLCKASFVRWYFDVNEGECKQFVYGGCGGNQNRYETMRECEIACLR